MEYTYVAVLIAQCVLLSVGQLHPQSSPFNVGRVGGYSAGRYPIGRSGLRFSPDSRYYQNNPRPTSGPNRCQGGARCCPGWMPNPSTGLCTIPLCRSSCGYGICRSPNLCQCMTGSYGANCGSPVGLAVCKKPCLNNGKCVGPDRCRCPYGFSGNQCEIDYRIGPCFTLIEENMCRAQLVGVKCTRESCCATVGAAWGVPCQKCPTERRCERGFYKNQRTGKCEDMNECRGIPNICAMGTCINTVGSYRCECGPGRKYNAKKFECADVDECDLNRGLCEFGRCENLDGTFQCACGSGYKAVNNGKRCVAKDVIGKCYGQYLNGKCVQESNTGVTKTLCCCGNPRRAFAADKCDNCPVKGTAPYRALGCSDDQGNIGAGGKGKGGVGDSGSGDGDGGDGKSGGDGDGSGEGVDECKLNSGLCEFGRCVNVPEGTFRCICNQGYKATNNGEKCIAVEKTDVCFGDFSNGKCSVKAPGKHSKSKCCCGNPNRAFGDCRKCPSKRTVAYRNLGCPDDQGNIGEGGKEGALGNRTTTGTGRDGDKGCNDIFRRCDNGECQTSLTGPLFCKCKAGFAKDEYNYCADINECTKFDGLCHGGKCVNTEGGFKCNCPAGYKQSNDGFSCEDIDECAIGNKCGPGVCKNFPGTYQCRCNKGYVTAKDVMTCVDHNECETPNICPNNGNCVNTEGSYKCDCSGGYRLNDDKVCVDINECETVRGICSNGHCVNTGGSFKCVCPTGYELAPDGRSCKDRNECKYIKDVCEGGVCVNGPGSYRCQCGNGFKSSESGTSCIDVRVESCFAKYNGFKCEMPLMKQLTRAECCCGMESTGMRAWGGRCKACPKNGTAEYTKVCMYGPGMDNNGNDIDECKNNAGTTVGVCNDGRCRNLMKDYNCVCNPGFKLKDDSNKICEDINECTEFNICKGGTCKNTRGGFTCTCPPGYDHNYVTKTCEDKNECETNPCRGGTCTNTLGSFKCTCPSGSVYDGTMKICTDNREGSCYAFVDNENRCERSIASLVSKSECCNGIGKAWGIDTCEVCDRDAGLGCRKGYKRVEDKCLDINECDFDGICANGNCVNTKGSFYCQCPKGFEVDPTRRHCIDKRVGVCYRKVQEDVCTMAIKDQMFMKADCCCSAFSQAWGSPCEICPRKNSPQFKELCPMGAGFEQNGNDVDECKIKGMCKNGRCLNTKGSYKCVCNSGFDLDESGTVCTDIDECSISKGICGQGTCINERGGFRCDCQLGYRNHAMMEMCVDINECVEMSPSPCSGGRCINTPGSFRCECPKGLKTMTGASSCEDIDECAENPGICPNGLCQNFIGGYHCRCKKGFRESRDMLQCIDIDECNVNKGGCEYSCENTPGSYQCGCRAGFELREDRKRCTDVDECARGSPCGTGNGCTNTVGGHICTCTYGYRPSLDAKACIDIDECREDPSICQNGECINTAGSFLCRCRLGYRLEPSAMACIDIDECKAQPNGGCHPDARCINNVGSYTCQCKPGYDGNGQICTDTNECALGLASCAQDAECKNTEGSFRCECKEGFNGDGEFCLDVNECLADENVCEPGTCMNTIGGYKCDCANGFEPSRDGKKCLDKNECLDTDVCDHGYCINTVGSYTCQCELGFQLDKTKTQCTDVNECEISGMCPNGKCKNMMGMYKCICDKSKGFMPNQNETGCTDMRMGYCYSKFVNNQTCGGAQLSSKKLMKQFCCCTGPDGSAWQEDSDKPCEGCPMMKTEDYKALCPGGTSTHVDETTNKIKKHNGCETLPGYCAGGTCEDTGEAGISCECPKGHQFNEDTFGCEDLNECLTDGICGYGAQCINVQGSYKCQCPDGYTFDKKANFCEDLRDYSCYLPILNPSGNCTNPLRDLVTIGKCCCGLPGGRYSSECQVCPTVGTGQRYALCIGKPSLPAVPTGQPPIGGPDVTPTSPTGTGSKNGTDGTDTDTKNNGTSTDSGGTDALVTTPTTTIDPRFDIDECQYFQGICAKGNCVNTIGSYQCECDQGFKEGREGMIKKCVDVDECAEGNPCEDGICNNIKGAFYCSCPEGLKLDSSNVKCVDLDECNTPGYCENGNCTNIIDGRGFRCECQKGYIKTVDGKTCEDMDECLMPDICTNGKCINRPGDYLCECNQGYKKDQSGKCVDVNECVEYPNLCNHGSCNNLEGSFLCECDQGFKQDQTKQSCQDINECTEPGFCENGRCTNKIGSAECRCNNGFEKTADGRSCEDANECDLPDAPCQFGGRCINMFGTFRCLCNPGFATDADSKECVDVRQSFCFSDTENGQCARANGMNITKSTCCCSMGVGWGATCELCPQKGTKEFEYYCPNGVGLTKDNTDINECKTNMGICKRGKCVNTDGSFRCDCDKGYVLNPKNPLECVDQNECTAVSNVCGSGNCTNTAGSYSCACESGFRNQVESPSCEDIDECAEQSNLCAFRCKNLQGSYMCTCPRGFKLSKDGKHCEDIDECQNPERCPFFCKNIVGSYRCLCPPGFRGDGKTSCIEINECSEESSLCKPGGKCENVEGSYRCVCTPPYMRSQNGKFCEDKSMSLCFSNLVDGVCQMSVNRMEKVSQRDCCCSGGGVAWGQDCRMCPDFSTSAGRSLCTRYQNRTINECTFIAGVCKNGKCMDTVESFRCMCNAGFQLSLDGKSCNDINECDDGNHKCPGQCRNTEGSYECVCPKGYVINEDKTKCIDEDECVTGNHDCPHNCENTEGGFTCVCPNGYKKQGNECKDVNECEDPGKCGLGTCRNVIGSYECVCGRGLKFDEGKKACVYITDGTGTGTDGSGTGTGTNPGGNCGVQGCRCPPGYYLYYQFGQVQCVDINECKQNMCGGSSCINQMGSYQCVCQQGYAFQGSACGDINECQNNPCSYGCSNNMGGFACQCPQGWSVANGGHCVATHGVSCFTCDTSDIPKEGVPLGGTVPPTRGQIGAHQSAVDTGSVPLFLELPTASQNYHFFPRRQGFDPPFAGGGGIGGGFLNGGVKQDGFSSSSSYTTTQSSSQAGGLGGGSDDGGFAEFNPYNPMYSHRKRRSVRKSPKPMIVKISSKSKTNTTLIKLSPMLKAMLGHMDYEITHGNTTLFALDKDAQGRPYVHTTGLLEQGKRYVLTVRSHIKKTKTKIEQELREIYGAEDTVTYKFKIRSV